MSNFFPIILCPVLLVEGLTSETPSQSYLSRLRLVGVNSSTFPRIWRAETYWKLQINPECLSTSIHRPVEDMIEEIKSGNSRSFAAGKLRELCKLLPEEDEVLLRILFNVHCLCVCNKRWGKLWDSQKLIPEVNWNSIWTGNERKIGNEGKSSTKMGYCSKHLYELQFMADFYLCFTQWLFLESDSYIDLWS